MSTDPGQHRPGTSAPSYPGPELARPAANSTTSASQARSATSAPRWLRSTPAERPPPRVLGVTATTGLGAETLWSAFQGQHRPGCAPPHRETTPRAGRTPGDRELSSRGRAAASCPSWTAQPHTGACRPRAQPRSLCPGSAPRPRVGGPQRPRTTTASTGPPLTYPGPELARPAGSSTTSASRATSTTHRGQLDHLGHGQLDHLGHLGHLGQLDQVAEQARPPSWSGRTHGTRWPSRTPAQCPGVPWSSAAPALTSPRAGPHHPAQAPARPPRATSGSQARSSLGPLGHGQLDHLGHGQARSAPSGHLGPDTSTRSTTTASATTARAPRPRQLGHLGHGHLGPPQAARPPARLDPTSAPPGHKGGRYGRAVSRATL